MQAVKALGNRGLQQLSSRSQRKNAPRYREVAARAGLKAALLLFRENLCHRLCIWREAFGSFRGHIRTQSATGQGIVILGPHSQNQVRNVRTFARRLYIEKLLAIRPWADSQDLQIFLMGFDAGEDWACCSVGKQYQCQTSCSSIWLTPGIASEIHATLEAAANQHVSLPTL